MLIASLCTGLRRNKAGADRMYQRTFWQYITVAPSPLKERASSLLHHYRVQINDGLTTLLQLCDVGLWVDR